MGCPADCLVQFRCARVGTQRREQASRRESPGAQGTAPSGILRRLLATGDRALLKLRAENRVPADLYGEPLDEADFRVRGFTPAIVGGSSAAGANHPGASMRGYLGARLTAAYAILRQNGHD